jgi:hypothetical protein
MEFLRLQESIVTWFFFSFVALYSLETIIASALELCVNIIQLFIVIIVIIYSL